jgi:hypothetical protein
MMTMRLVRFLPCLAVLALVGCGPSSGSISGKVTYKDKPLPGGTVAFLTSDQKVKTAIINNDGSYTIDKVTVGPAKISVSPPVAAGKMPKGMKMDPSKMGAPAGAAPPTDDKPVSLPDKYKDPEKSGLTYTIIKGKQEHNIELK